MTRELDQTTGVSFQQISLRYIFVQPMLNWAQTWDLSQINVHRLDKFRLKAIIPTMLKQHTIFITTVKIISNTNNVATEFFPPSLASLLMPHIEKNQVAVKTKVWTEIGRKREELTVGRTPREEKSPTNQPCIVLLISRHGSHCGRHYVCTVHF